MKISRILTYSILSVMAASAFTSCEDDVVVGQVENPDRDVAGDVVYVTDQDGKRIYTTVDLRDTKAVPLYVNTAAALAQNCQVEFTYDAAVVAEYNAQNGTDIQAVPQSMVVLGQNGVATLAAGSKVSEPMTMTLTSDGSLDNAKTYAVPLRMKVTSGSATIAKNSTSRLVFVRDLTGLPDATKYVIDAETGEEVPAVRTMFCMEINNINPLWASAYTMKKSGKMYYDAIMLFAANINYNDETGRVYINCNENVAAILAKREHYLQPLQDRGMKVYLSILGNWDRANVDNLSDETARYFAQEIKNYCDTYKLDGVFYNSEYGSPIYPAPEGFVTPSNAAAARLFYEVKKIQPERDNIIYTYDFSSLPSVDGAEPGEFMDFIWTNYGGSAISDTAFPGVPRFNLGHYSWELSQGRTSGDLASLRAGGYGLHVHFGNKTNLTAYQKSAAALYDDEVVYDGKVYTKDWL